MSLKKEFLNRLSKEVRPIPGGTLEDFARTLGYKASTASRRLRELANSGLISPNYDNGYVQYTISNFLPESREIKKDGIDNGLYLLPQTTSNRQMDTSSIHLYFEVVKK